MEDQLLHLVGMIYDAALDESQWPKVLQTLGQQLNATTQTLNVFAQDPMRVTHSVIVNEDPAYLPSYNAYYLGVSPFVAPLGDVGTHVFASHEVIPDQELERTEFHNDWQRPQDFFYGTGILLMEGKQPMTLLNLNRDKARGPFSTAERQLLERLLPHMERATRLMTHVGTLTAGWDGAVNLLDRMSSGVVLIDERRMTVHVNAAADQIARSGRGLVLGAKGVSARNAVQAKRLAQLVAEAVLTGQGQAAHPGGSMALEGRPDDAPLPVTVIPIRGARVDMVRAGRRICAALLIQPPEVTVPVPETLLIELFGLTQAEARLVSTLASGLSVTEAADRFGVSSQTTRNQLKQAFQKVGVKRQGELIRRVLALPGAWVRKL